MRLRDMTSAEHSRKEILLVDPTGLPLDIDTTVVEQIPNTETLMYSPIMFHLILCRIPEQYQTVADCTYTLAVGFEEKGTIDDSPIWGTAVAISEHYLLTATHAVQWIANERGPIDPKETKVMYFPKIRWCLILAFMPLKISSMQ